MIDTLLAPPPTELGDGRVSLRLMTAEDWPVEVALSAQADVVRWTRYPPGLDEAAARARIDSRIAGPAVGRRARYVVRELAAADLTAGTADPATADLAGAVDPATADLAGAVDPATADPATANLTATADPTAGIAGTAGISIGTRHAPEVFYALLPEHRGRGLATAATQLLTTWALDAGHDHVLLMTVVGNTASDAVARRAGFTSDAVETVGPDGASVRLRRWSARR